MPLLLTRCCWAALLQLVQGDLLVLRAVEANCIAVRVFKAGSNQALAVAAVSGCKQAAPPATLAGSPASVAGRGPHSSGSRAAPQGSHYDLFYSSSDSSSDGESDGNSEEGGSSPGDADSDDEGSSSEGEELRAGGGSPACFAQGITSARASGQARPVNSVWHEFPAASRQFAFCVPLRTVEKRTISVPGAVPCL